MTSATEHADEAGGGSPTAAPLYVQLKDYVRSRIETGEWPAHHRVPSENELVDRLGVSRMTANRALRELAAEGVVVRIRGKGSFVAVRKRSSLLQGVPNIADEIALRGGRHSAEVVLLRNEACGPDLAGALEIEAGARVAHSIIVHREDDLAIQVEDRFVNPAAAPDYLAQDFTKATPNGYLRPQRRSSRPSSSSRRSMRKSGKPSFSASRGRRPVSSSGAGPGRAPASFRRSGCSTREPDTASKPIPEPRPRPSRAPGGGVGSCNGGQTRRWKGPLQKGSLHGLGPNDGRGPRLAHPTRAKPCRTSPIPTWSPAWRASVSSSASRRAGS